MTTSEERLMLRLEADGSKLLRETAKLNKTLKDQMRALDSEFQRNNSVVVAGVQRKTQALAQAGAGMANYRFQVQNAAYQVGDFAVQVAGGTSAARAAAQQLPQLLGGLGMFGALAGAAATISASVTRRCCTTSGNSSATATSPRESDR